MYYFEPKQKVGNRIWANKMPDAQVLPKNTNGKKGCVCYFFTNKGPAIRIWCQKVELSQASSIKTLF